ncbi:MAG: hypothetical protein KF799_10680 [Bdellovibrionales bacterium]|nr:hypothetical protein [Bdellovibrionales bacterium]
MKKHFFTPSHLILGIFTCSISFSFSAAAADSCGAEKASSSFLTGVRGALALAPAVDANVEKCFNPERSEYIAQTNKTLKALTAQYRIAEDGIGSTLADLQNGRVDSFTRAVAQTLPAVAKVNQPVIDNASSLKNFGFTTSDAMVGNEYKYPLCNSSNNDQPAQKWAAFYQNVTAVQRASRLLQTSAACLKD